MTARNAGTGEDATQDLALDGIYYACLSHMGEEWRLGALTPLWLEELAAIPIIDGNAQKSLESRGIWISRAKPAPPLAVMCCGLGSIWPGMGRELYDNFPAARNAMDRIASLADWDILGLMDERDLIKISQTRWQIPYLFLLEYAQWSQFVSLGLKPAMVCGHSLGELVALCLAGVYSLESAWYLLDTRAEHITELESKSSKQSGMLAISAEYSIISDIILAYPDLSISNRNTSRQYILSGPRESLVKARKSLRSRHIPAMLLNISLAFHNPAMRILRDLSLRRLNALEMRAPKIPMLSCVTAGLYPDQQKNICSYITDLDENTVAWEGSVQAMRDTWGIRYFLELGPRDTLCGLVEEIDQRNVCIASDAKGRETQAMRETCARLFSLGYLSFADIRQVRDTRSEYPTYTGNVQASPISTNSSPALSLAGIDSIETHKILEMIAQVTKKNVSDIRLDMDLRYDLGLRSSSFPFIIREAEERLGYSVELENLVQLVTVADLVRFLTGNSNSISQEDSRTSTQPRIWRDTPLERFLLLQNANNDIELCSVPLEISLKGLGLPNGSLVAILAYDDEIFPRICASLAPLKPRFAVPRNLIDKCIFLQKAGAEIIEMAYEQSPKTKDEEIIDSLHKLTADHGAPTGIIIPAISQQKGTSTDTSSLFHKIASICTQFALECTPHPWICAIESIQVSAGADDAADIAQSQTFFALTNKAFSKELSHLAIAWLHDTSNSAGHVPDEIGDMFAEEILYGARGNIIWKQGDSSHKYCRASSFFNLVYPETTTSVTPQAGLFQGECQFSRFADITLSTHGSGIYTPANLGECAGQGPLIPWLPLCKMLAAILQGANTLAPWLSVIGFSDMRIFNIPALPYGITREFRLQSRARPWIPQDGVITRMCHVSLSGRELTPNGRHAKNYIPICAGVCWLAGTIPPVPPLWPMQMQQYTIDTKATETLNTFYESLGFGPPWKMLTHVLQSHPPIYEYYFEAPEIEKDINWNYKDFLFMVEGVFEGSMHILANGCDLDKNLSRQDIANNLKPWRCNAIGFIRFAGLPKKNTQCFYIQLRRSWQDDRVVRFDAQVCDYAGLPILTLNHLEFERIVT